MKKPLLSVCIITYNHVGYIREAIDSLLAQKVQFDWELIIADDCSTDGTRDILLEYKKKYPDLIHLILQKKNVGPEQNWLDLISYPKTKYLLYTEGDDYIIDPTKLQKQVDYLEAHHDVSVCFHPVKVIYENESRADEIFPDPEQYAKKKTLGLDDLLASNFMQTNSVMYRWDFTRRSVRDAFPKDIIPGDWFLHLLHAQVGKIGFMSDVMSVYRRHKGGIWWESSHDIDKIWQKYGLNHLRFYAEVLKLYGDEPARSALIYPAIYTMLETFIRVDKKYGSHIFLEAVTQFPQLAVEYTKRKHIEWDRDRALVQTLEQAQQRYETAIAQKQQQIDAIKASRVWRFRNWIARCIGRPQV